MNHCLDRVYNMWMQTGTVAEQLTLGNSGLLPVT